MPVILVKHQPGHVTLLLKPLYKSAESSQFRPSMLNSPFSGYSQSVLDNHRIVPPETCFSLCPEHTSLPYLSNEAAEQTSALPDFLNPSTSPLYYKLHIVGPKSLGYELLVSHYGYSWTQTLSSSSPWSGLMMGS